jgi:hypothetical protein
MYPILWEYYSCAMATLLTSVIKMTTLFGKLFEEENYLNKSHERCNEMPYCILGTRGGLTMVPTQTSIPVGVRTAHNNNSSPRFVCAHISLSLYFSIVFQISPLISSILIIFT